MGPRLGRRRMKTQRRLALKSSGNPKRGRLVRYLHNFSRQLKFLLLIDPKNLQPQDTSNSYTYISATFHIRLGTWNFQPFWNNVFFVEHNHLTNLTYTYDASFSCFWRLVITNYASYNYTFQDKEKKYHMQFIAHCCFLLRTFSSSFKVLLVLGFLKVKQFVREDVGPYVRKFKKV